MEDRIKEFDRIPCLEAIGPWPFTTRRVYSWANGPRIVWHSRYHRKGLLRYYDEETTRRRPNLLSCLWMPRELNWWIGVIFALGASLFALASVLTLSPALAHWWLLNSTAISAIYFAGSIPFTTAAYLQLYQAANAGDFPRADSAVSRRAYFGWKPHEIGWLSAALQFAGTILFNINTFDAMSPSPNWLGQDLAIWAPNLIGSILFLASGYLAFIETCHAYWAWNPGNISWDVVFANLFGCAGFMASAWFAVVSPQQSSIEAITLSVIFTLLGAIGFFVGALLMLPEAVLPPKL